MTSCDNGPTGAKANTSEVSDPRNRPNEAQSVSEQVPGHLRRRKKDNSPRSARDELDRPNDEAVVPNDVHGSPEDPEGIINGRVSGTNALRPTGVPGDHMEVRAKRCQATSRTTKCAERRP